MSDNPAAFEIGSTVYSATRYHADDDSLPLGGIVIDIYTHVDDLGEIEVHARTVTVYRGRVVYTTIPVTDIVPGQSNGLIRRDVLKQLASRLQADAAEKRDPFVHDDALQAIKRVLADRGDPAVRRVG